MSTMGIEQPASIVDHNPTHRRVRSRIRRRHKPPTHANTCHHSHKLPHMPERPLDSSLLYRSDIPHIGLRPGAARQYHNVPRQDEEAALGIRRIGDYPIGFGGYSDVWKAKMRIEGSTRMVALKVLRLRVSRDRLRKREERESTWSELEHDNIAPLIAIYRQPNGSPVFVSHWYENGTADQYLQDNPVVHPITIIYEIASGVEYLHSIGIVHGDLKGSNVLIDDGGHARLIDFGLSRLVNDQAGLTTTTHTSLRWCAPELLLDHPRPTVPGDIYAFASTALQLLTGNLPYHGLNTFGVLRAVSSRMTPRSLSAPVRYNIPRSTSFWRVLESCWGEAPVRPSITRVKRHLRSMYA